MADTPDIDYHSPNSPEVRQRADYGSVVRLDTAPCLVEPPVKRGDFPNRFKFRDLQAGIEEIPANFHIPRHRHLHCHATIVLRGSFEEAGLACRTWATEGNLLISPILDSHIYRMDSQGMRLLRLPWPDTETQGGLYMLDDLERVARLAERDIREASAMLQDFVKTRKPASSPLTDWPDVLASDLRGMGPIKISEWAERYGLSRETISRGFSAVYGIPPVSFRSECRARFAWIQLKNRTVSLSRIATESGFSDQSHMTRWIGRITGAPPSFWRTCSETAR